MGGTGGWKPSSIRVWRGLGWAVAGHKPQLGLLQEEDHGVWAGFGLAGSWGKSRKPGLPEGLP